MAQYALVKDNVVINVILWDGVTDYAPPDGVVLVQSDTCGCGNLYNLETGEFSAPEAQV